MCSIGEQDPLSSFPNESTFVSVEAAAAVQDHVIDHLNVAHMKLVHAYDPKS